MGLKITFCLLFAFCSSSFAQIKYEPGYFIDNEGLKTDCLIKNYDWKNNPVEIEFKLDASQASTIAPISSVSMFEILNESKFVREKVQIDRSSDQISKLSTFKEPNFTDEILFLKVLIEGSASLYSYEDRNLKRFFYKTEETPIQQLVYKKYSVGSSSIGTNATFRYQIRAGVNCEGIELKKIENLGYETRSLTKYFINYNECRNEPFKHYNVKTEGSSIFHIRVKTGVDYATLKFESPLSKTNETFDPVISPRIGLEAEFILPINRNKWAVVMEPTYQNYRTEYTISYTYGVPSRRSARVEYASIELPIGIRHYFYLSEKSKIFANAFVLLDFELDSSIEIERRDPFPISSHTSFSFGAGYQYGRAGVELRYSTPKDLVPDHQSWTAFYDKFSLVLGYKLF